MLKVGALGHWPFKLSPHILGKMGAGTLVAGSVMMFEDVAVKGSPFQSATGRWIGVHAAQQLHCADSQFQVERVLFGYRMG